MLSLNIWSQGCSDAWCGIKGNNLWEYQGFPEPWVASHSQRIRRFSSQSLPALVSPMRSEDRGTWVSERQKEKAQSGWESSLLPGIIIYHESHHFPSTNLIPSLSSLNFTAVTSYLVPLLPLVFLKSTPHKIASVWPFETRNQTVSPSASNILDSPSYSE